MCANEGMMWLSGNGEEIWRGKRRVASWSACVSHGQIAIRLVASCDNLGLWRPLNAQEDGLKRDDRDVDQSNPSRPLMS